MRGKNTTNVFQSFHEFDFSMKNSSRGVNVIVAAQVDHFDSKNNARGSDGAINLAIGPRAYEMTFLKL